MEAPIMKGGTKRNTAYVAVPGHENHPKDGLNKMRVHYAILVSGVGILVWLSYLTWQGSYVNVDGNTNKTEMMEELIKDLLQADHDNIDDLRNRRYLENQIWGDEGSEKELRDVNAGTSILNTEDDCGGDEEVCQEMLTLFEKEAHSIITTLIFNESSSMLLKMLDGEKKYVKNCEQEYHTETQTVEKHGDAYWISPMHREDFYEGCLKKFDINRLQRKATRVVKKMKQFAQDMSERLNEKGTVQIGGGTAQVIGGVMGGIGLILAPFTAGTSLLTLNLAGSAIATGGSMASFIQPFLTEKWTGQLVTQSTAMLKETEKEVDFVQTLLGLFIDSSQKRETLLSSDDYHKIQSTFTDLFLQKMRSGILAGGNLAKFAGFGKASYLAYINRYPASIAARIKTKFRPIPKTFTSFKATAAFQRMSKWGISKAVQEKIKTITKNAGTGFLSALNIGFGVWDILKGVEGIDGHGDLSDIFRAAAKKYSYDTDGVLHAYREIVGESDIAGYEDSYEEVTRISLKSVNGQNYAGAKLQLESWNPNNQTEGGTCETNLLDKNSYHALTAEHWYLLDSDELNDCNYFKVFNENVTVRLMNDYSDTVAISHVTISTETQLVPALACTSDGTMETQDTSTISASGGISSSLTCFAFRGIVMVKTHTTDQSYSGTDGFVRLLITQYNINKANGEPYGIQNAHCTTNWLDNSGDDRERGQVDTYRMDTMGGCTAPFHQDFTPDHGGHLGTKIEHQNMKWTNDEWCLDTLKIYAKTSIGRTKAFRCDVWNIDGTGTCLSGSTTPEKVCKLEKPNARGIEKIKLHVTDNTWASSYGILQLKICNDEDTNQSSDEHNCCYTNQVYGTYTRNTDFTLDGDDRDELEGEDLGQCEGFIIKGAKVSVRVNKQDGNSVSFDRISFFGASDLLVTTSDIPFIRCSGKQIWAEDKEIYWHDANGDETDWMDWTTPAATWLCQYEDATTIKTVHVKLCSDSTAGTSSTIETEFANLDKNKCNTRALFNNDNYLAGGDFYSFTDLGNCSSHPVIDSRIYMRLKNVDEKDNLCLTHVWVDVSNSKGEVKQLQCKFHAEKRNKNVIRKDGSRIPMLCQ